jgi:Siphovirus Gp157
MSIPSLSLYRIDLELLELLHAREELAQSTEMAPQEIEAALANLDKQIASYLPQALANRADEVAGLIRHWKAQDEADAAEVKRIQQRKKKRTEAAEYLQNTILELMERAGQKRIEGQHVTLKRVGNPPKVVTQDDLVPHQFIRTTVKMSLLQLLQIGIQLRRTPEGRELFNELHTLTDARSDEPMLREIAAELKKPCPECYRAGHDEKNGGECEVCGGSGKASVPGCSLKPSERLEIE